MCDGQAREVHSLRHIGGEEHLLQNVRVTSSREFKYFTLNWRARQVESLEIEGEDAI